MKISISLASPQKSISQVQVTCFYTVSAFLVPLKTFAVSLQITDTVSFLQLSNLYHMGGGDLNPCIVGLLAGL
jgi:hypothetical protein